MRKLEKPQLAALNRVLLSDCGRSLPGIEGGSWNARLLPRTDEEAFGQSLQRRRYHLRAKLHTLGYIRFPPRWKRRREGGETTQAGLLLRRFSVWGRAGGRSSVMRWEPLWAEALEVQLECVLIPKSPSGGTAVNCHSAFIM